MRTLDRQITGFTTDEIYSWLMGVRPQSTVADEMMQSRAPDDKTNRSAQHELLWSLAVLAKFPLGLPSEFVLQLLRSHGVEDEVQPYLEQL